MQVMDGLWLVGDSVFPGQSTLATAVGGVRTAASIASRG
jgi:phytoene dehydrogenase-like protein